MSDDPNERGLSRRWIVSAVEASLRRLESDYLDIFFLHKPDEHTDLSESLETASDLVRAGKVRFIGTSSYPPINWCKTMGGANASPHGAES